MRRRTRGLAAAVGALGLVALRAEAAPVTAADLDFCFQVRPLETFGGQLLGHLCVVAPSATDPDPDSGLLDFDPDCTTGPDGETCESGNGYGYHVVAFPTEVGGDSPSALLVSGAYGSPHSPIAQDHLELPPDTIRYTRTLQDALLTGHVVLQPAYRNPSSVNRDVCDVTSDPVAGANPHCHFLLRTLVLEGAQRCPPGFPGCATLPHLSLGSPALDAANAYLRRLDLLLAHLGAEGLPLPTALSELRWQDLRVVGHSQGSGHAYLIAKLLHRVGRACYMAGPRDWDKNPPPGYASWFTPVSQGSLTPLSAMRALVSDKDADGAITAAWEHLGLQVGVHGRVVHDDPGDNGHVDVFDDPNHTPDRIALCFPPVAGVPALPAVPTGLLPVLGVGIAALGLAARRRRAISAGLVRRG